MRFEKLSPALGALVGGIDVQHAAEGDWAVLRSALFERYHLLVFRDLDLSDDEHVDVVRHFGPIAKEGAGESSEFRFVSNVRPDGALGSIAASWHIDFGFFEHPYEAISLYGLEIPSDGTETRFANALLAAANLPDALRERVADLRARQVADVTCPLGEAVVRVRLGRLDESYPHFVRPVLWPHHTTGRPILGVWEQQTDALLPLDPDDSTALIEELYAHLYQDRHVYVHKWERRDLLIWDNHAIQHSRPEVGTEAARTLRRVSVGRTQDLSIFAARAVHA